jgi:hypothetical protein
MTTAADRQATYRSRLQQVIDPLKKIIVVHSFLRKLFTIALVEDCNPSSFHQTSRCAHAHRPGCANRFSIGELP